MYDLVIVGGGPAGYTAGIYAGMARLNTVILEATGPGGQMVYTPEIWNYPGFPEGVDGVTLAGKMRQGAECFGVNTVFCRVDGFSKTEKTVTAGDRVFQGRTVIFATGAGHRHLQVPGEERLTGRGVSYCATCDAVLYRDRTVVVVGGGNGAASDALLLSRLAKKVILLHRRDRLRADAVAVRRLEERKNVKIRYNSVVREILGEDRVAGLRLENGETVCTDGVFISIGQTPNTGFLKDAINLDPEGYIPAGEDCKTEIPGVFAAGDVRRKPLRQIVTATADGAVAAWQAKRFLFGE